jgi:homoserine kinase type II
MAALMGTFRTLSSEDVRAILAGFGLENEGYRHHQAIAAGTVNTNLSVDTARRRLFLRVNEGKDAGDVEREATIIAHVAERGLATPAPLRTTSGAPFLPWGGSFVSLFPWVAGATLGRAAVGPDHARASGAALAQLHRLGADLPDHRPGRYEPAEIRRRFQLVSALGDPALSETLAVVGPELDRLEGERAGVVPAGLIHGDLFIDNVLFDGPRVAALLDFEQASWGRLVYDIAVSVLAFGYGATDFRPEVTRAFIEGYAAERLPAAVEREVFGAELRFAACRFAVTRITDVHLRKQAGAPAGKDFRRYVERLRRVNEHLQRRDGLLALP